MKRLWKAMLPVVLVVLLAAGGCGVKEPEQETRPETGVTVTDQAGREITFDAAPAGIISLSPSITEMVFALGLGDRLVGITDYCNYPPEAAAIESVGGFSTPSIEMIAVLEPDLVLTGDLQVELWEQLEEMQIPFMVISPRTVEDIYAALLLVGRVSGDSARAEALVEQMRGRIDAIREKQAVVPEAERVSVFYEVYSDPLMSAGNATVIHQVITLAGGVNIFADVETDYPQISTEAVVERDPAVILFPDYHGTAAIVSENMKERSGWGEIKAIKDNRVYSVHDDIFTRPGPRVAEAVEMTAQLLYPDLF